MLASQQSHYSLPDRRRLAGHRPGQRHRGAARTLDNSIDLAALEAAAREALDERQQDRGDRRHDGLDRCFGIDDLQAIDALRDRLVDGILARLPAAHPRRRRDRLGLERVQRLRLLAATRWAFAAARCARWPAAVHRIRHLRLADSIGIDFHKTGLRALRLVAGAVSRRRAISSSSPAGRARRCRTCISRASTIRACTRWKRRAAASGPMAALANLLLFGKEGYRTLLGHAVEMAEVLRELIEVASEPDGAQRRERRPGDAVSRLSRRRRHVHRQRPRAQRRQLPRRSCCAHNDYNRRIFERVHAEALAGHGVAISLTDCYRQTDYGEPIVALKTYVLSPFADESQMQTVLEEVLKARERL